MEFILFLLIGALSGFSAGLLGIGGGLITVPAMVMLLPHLGFEPDSIMHIAIATSLAAIIPTSMMSAFKHHKHNAIHWDYVRRLVPGLVLGSLLGVFLAVYISREPLQLFFATFVLLLSAYMFTGQPLPRQDTQGRDWLEKIVSTGIGALSALLGVGGGTMTVPYLVWRGVSARVAVGTSAFCGLPIALTAVLAFLLSTGLSPQAVTGAVIYWQGLFFIVAGSLLFTPVGVNVTHKIATPRLKKLFALLLFFVSIDLFLDVFR